HQDLDREALDLGDDAGDAGHARGDPRRLRGDGPPRRHEARRRDQEREAGGADARARPRDARARLADARPVPLRRLVAPERRADADPQGEDRPLPVSRLLHDRLNAPSSNTCRPLARDHAAPEPTLALGKAASLGRDRVRPLAWCSRPRSATALLEGALTELEQRGGRTPAPSKWDYASAPESREIVTLEERYGLFVGGEFVEPRSGDYYQTIAPASEEPLAEIPQAGAEDVALAVSTAREAYEDGWSAAVPAERAKYLYRIARILQERSREFAVLEALNGGKPIRESRDVDLPLAAAHFFYYAGWADKIEYAFPHRSPKPLGVVGQIIPWNFPLLMAAWKLAPALATGNTSVLKPAETTPLTALLLAEVLQEVDLPPGVVNILTGAGETGSALVEHPGVAKVAVTGPTDVGRRIGRG